MSEFGLYVRALELADAYDIIMNGEVLVPFEEANKEAAKQTSDIEHVCHELAHAATLNISFGPELSRRIQDYNPSETSEVRTFAVVMMALDGLGIRYDEATMYDSINIQVPSWARSEVFAYWNVYRAEPWHQRQARRIVGLFLHEEWT